MAALTTTGITIDDLDTILDAIEADELANIDANLQVTADSVAGQLNAIFAAALAEAHELMEEIYQSAYPDTASGQSLSYIAALTGAIRQAATKAEVDVQLDGTAGETILAGVRAYPATGPDYLFETVEDVLLTGGSGTTTMVALTAGSEPAVAGSEGFVITTPRTHLTSITALAGTPLTEGLDEETDAELRLRRNLSLARSGSSTVDAIRAAMLTVTGVDTCTVFENPSTAVDSNGLPPHSIEVLVHSSAAPNYTAQAVADQIWASKPAGTQTYGTLGPETVTDSSGNSHDIYYSEPTTLRTYVDVALTYSSDYVGDDAVQEAIATWASTTLAVGEDVHASDIVQLVAGLTGVDHVDVQNTCVDDDATPAGVFVVVTGSRQLATIAEADITVTSTAL